MRPAMLAVLCTLLSAAPGFPDDSLFAAARKGDVAAARARLADGIDVNIKTAYGATALSFACDKGHLELVRELLKAKADPNVTDTFYQATPMTWALRKGHTSIAIALIEGGSEDVVEAIKYAALKGDAELLEVVLRHSSLEQEALDAAFALATDDRLAARLREAGATQTPRSTVGSATNTSVASVATQGAAQQIEGIQEAWTDTSLVAEPEPRASVIAQGNWPQFRGNGATGVADGQFPPTAFDGVKGINIWFRTPIPGLGHSCPTIFNSRIYLTTAISDASTVELKTGQYEDVASVSDETRHVWRVYSIDAGTGAIVWSRTACAGVPKVKRHPKGSHATPTVATDGRYIIANFGSEGMFCYDTDGHLLWKVNLGELDSGWFYDPGYEWGYGSSPVIWRDRVFVQCDVGRGSYIAAYALKDGRELWRTSREEIPSWGTPTVVESVTRAELVTNASRFARGYHPETGLELWRLGRHAEITVPTPFAAKGLIFITSGYNPIQPIYAIRAGAAEGDVSLNGNAMTNDAVAWSKLKGGPYLPTPIAYGDYFYVCSNTGILTCYELATGKDVYRQRLGGSAGYTASPVAADGRLYFAGEDGDVRVVRAGAKYELLAINHLGEVVLATPAISNGMLYIRSQSHLYGLKADKGGGTGRFGTPDKR